MSDTPTAQETCPNCIKKGLALLPVRYAVARDDTPVTTNAPPLTAPFGDGVTSIALPATAARYTLRGTREGYLYVFNEARGLWSAYESDKNGVLTEFDPHAKSPPQLAEDDAQAAACSRTGVCPMARCIFIPDAAQATRIWICYSQAAWTPAVLANNRRSAVRAKHMRCIDIRAWVAGGGKATQPHLCSIEEVGTRVADYTVEAPRSTQPNEVIVTSYIAYASSPQGSIVARKDEVPDMVAQAKAAGEQWGYPPAIIALADPCGIAMELVAVAGDTLASFVRRHSDVRKIAVSRAIQSVRRAIEADAENRKIYSVDRNAHQMADGGVSGQGSAGLALARAIFPEMQRQRDENYEAWRDATPAQLATAQTDAWDKYLGKYDETARANTETNWNSTMEVFDKTLTTPITRAHVAWMKSEQLVDYFDCNCDDADVNSGLEFVRQVVACVGDSQQYATCFTLYKEWFGATHIERTNLLLRAMGYNQKAVLGRIDRVAQGGFAPDALKGLPWDQLINGYADTMGSLGEAGQSAITRLLLTMGGAITSVAGKAVDHVIGPGLVFLGVIGKAPIVQVEVTMSKANAIQELVARMTAVNPKVAEVPDLRRAIDLEMRRARIYGTPVHGTGKFRYLLIANMQVIEDFPGMTANMTPRRFAEATILTEADHRTLTRQRWRSVLPQGSPVGAITAVLQIVALGKLAEDLDKSMVHERASNRNRFITGVAGMTGMLSDFFGDWIERAAAAGSRLGIRLNSTFGWALRAGGKVLGLGAGVVMAALDLYAGFKEYSEGNRAIAFLYVASAVSSVAALVAFSSLGPLIFGAAATGIGVVLVVIVIVIAILIEVFKDNKIQDWLERCSFGNLANERYADGEVEMAQLKLAIEG